MPEIVVTEKDKVQLPEALNDPAGNLLRPDQMLAHEQEIKEAKESLENPRIQNKGDVMRRIRQMSAQYERQAPKPITDGSVKDKLYAESKQLLQEIVPGMLSQEEMRKNPAGAVDKHLKWERANKAKILRWKKIQCMLNADSSSPATWDRDAANLEKFRPEGAQDRLRLNAQIGGHMSYGSVSEENWAEVFGRTHPVNSALNQTIRATATSPETQPSDEKPSESAARKK